MKQKLILFTCFLCIILTLTACSKEARGVPDSVIRRYTRYDIDEASEYSLIHNVDTAAHIDDLKMILQYNGTYGSKTVEVPCSYQYNKSDDSWTLLNEGTATSKQVLDEDAYIKASPWQGTYTGSHANSYSITFLSIDMKKMKAVIHCDIDFKNGDIPDLDKTVAVDLYETGGAYNLSFGIDYIYPSIIGTQTGHLSFWLDVNNGLCDTYR